MAGLSIFGCCTLVMEQIELCGKGNVSSSAQQQAPSHVDYHLNFIGIFSTAAVCVNTDAYIVSVGSMVLTLDQHQV